MSGGVFTVVFWKDAAERAVRTAAQALGGLWTAGAVTDLIAVNWRMAGAVAGFSALLSLVNAVATAPFGPRDTASLVSPERVPYVGRHAAR